MRLKVYHAPNMGAAMAMVRTDLGPDALILATRPADGGIEITAALEAAPVAAPAPPDPKRQAALRWHGVPEPLRTQLASGDAVSTLTDAFGFGSLPLEPAAAPLALVGPPGAGKTLTVARLATRLVLAGQRPLVVTADGKRAGAAEQLAAFTRLLGLTLIAADEPVTLARALARRAEGAPVLIDTPGLNWSDPVDCRSLSDLLASCGCGSALVLPSGLDPAEAGEIADAFVGLGATMLVPTRLDQSRRLGGILAAAGAGLAFTEAGFGAGVVDGLRALSPRYLADLLGTAATLSRTEEKLIPASPAPAPPPLPPYIRPREGQSRRVP